MQLKTCPAIEDDFTFHGGDTDTDTNDDSGDDGRVTKRTMKEYKRLPVPVWPAQLKPSCPAIEDDFAFHGGDTDTDTDTNDDSRDDGRVAKRTMKEYKTSISRRLPVPVWPAQMFTDPDQVAVQLRDCGVAVFPAFSEEERLAWSRAYFQSLSAAPEFTHHATKSMQTRSGRPLVPTAGGYGATGHPSGFHDLFARQARRTLFEQAKPVFKAYVGLVGKPMYWAALFERNRYRPWGKTTAPSMIVRKQSPKVAFGTEVFGSFVNLSSVPVVFTCILGSHKDLPAWEAVGTTDRLPPSADAAFDLTKRLQNVMVPPGHTILFFQHLWQRILSTPARTVDHLHLLMAYTLSPSPELMFDVEQVIREQGVPLIKSGQRPPLYDKLHVSFQSRTFTTCGDQKETLLSWSQDTFVDAFLTKTPTGKVIVKREAPSLLEAGLPMHPEYSEDDKAIFKPCLLTT